jgi:AbrB family looped-hinge helix DNA binding protein
MVNNGMVDQLTFTATVRTQYRLVIPPTVRETLGISEGDSVTIIIKKEAKQ